MRKRRRYAGQIKKLFSRLKREGGKATLQPVDDPMEQLLRGILGTFASESRAEAALGKLHAAVVDLNELRVTPIAEIVGIIGVDYPHCRRAAEEISRGLQSVFYHLHGLDLSFLKASSRKAAEAFLNSLDGVGPHARATVIMRCLQGHAVPLDVHMHDYLRRNAYIPEGASVEDAQKRLTRAIRECDAGSFYVLLKRYAGARAPRKPEARKVPASGAVAAKTGTKAKPKPKAKTSPGKPAPKKKTARRKPTSIKTKRKTASTTAGRARKAPAEKPRKKAKKVAAPKKEATSTKKRAVGKRPRRAHKAFASRSR